MHYQQTLPLATLLTLAVASDPYGAIFAGGSQSAPGPSQPLTPVPTVGSVSTDAAGSTIIVPLPPGNPGGPVIPTYSGSAPTETIPSVTGSVPGYPTSVATTPLPYPIYNSTTTGGAAGGTAPGGTGNLSTTLGSATTTGSSSTVLITTTGEGGQPVTQTSVVAVQPSATGGEGGAGSSGSAGSPSGSTQPGAGSALKAGSAVAMAVVMGVGAFFL